MVGTDATAEKVVARFAADNRFVGIGRRARPHAAPWACILHDSNSQSLCIARVTVLRARRDTFGSAVANIQKNPTLRQTRVLLVAPQPLYEDRGTPIAIKQVLLALSQLGCEVDVLTYPVGADVSIPGVRWIRVGNPLRFRHVPVGFSWRKVFLDVLLARRFFQLIRSRRYDLVHAVEEAGFIAALKRRSSGIPLLYDMQSSIPQQLSKHRIFRSAVGQNVLRRFERWLLRTADLVVASQGLAAYVHNAMPGTAVEEWHYPAGTFSDSDTSRNCIREELGLSEGARTVVYSGTFEAYQGLAELVVAARKVVDARPETVFVAIGGDHHRAVELAEQARTVGLSDHFRIIERQPRERALAFIYAADVVVSPRAHGDNLPLKIMDYMSATKPIVATRIPAHTAVLDSTRAVLTGTNGSSLADGILSVLDDERKAEQLAIAARDYGEKHLGWNGFLDSIRYYRERLLSAGGPVAEPSQGTSRPRQP